MENIINVNALREALESGMSSSTIHTWVDDTIAAMDYFNHHYDRNYIAVSKADLNKVQTQLSNIKQEYQLFNLFNGHR